MNRDDHKRHRARRSNAADQQANLPRDESIAKRSSTSPARWIMVVGFLLAATVFARWGMPAIRTAQGDRSMARGEWVESHQNYQAALWWNDHSDEAKLGAIRATRKSGDFAGAERLIDEYQADASSNRAMRIQRDLIAIQNGSKLNDDRFIAELLTKYPQLGAEILEAAILGFDQRQQPREAKFYAEQWMQGAPDDAWARFYLARAESQLGELEIAKLGLIEAAKQPQLFDRICIELARVDMRMENHAEAIALLEPAINADPQNIELRLLRCNALLSLRRRSDAIAELHQVLSLAPLNFGARISLATQLVEQEQPLDVIELLKPFESQFSQDLTVNYLLAQSHYALNQTADGLRYLEVFMEGRKAVDQLLLKRRLMERENGSGEEWLALAEGYLKYRWEEAGPMLFRAAALLPDDERVAKAYDAFNAKQRDR